MKIYYISNITYDIPIQKKKEKERRNIYSYMYIIHSAYNTNIQLHNKTIFLYIWRIFLPKPLQYGFPGQ